MRVFSNHAISLDGKISTFKNELVPIGSSVDARAMRCLRGQADAILAGGNTFRNTFCPMLPKRECATRNLKTNPIYNVIVTRRMDFNLTEKFIKEDRVRFLFFTTADNVPGDFPFECIQIKDTVSPVQVVKELERRGVESLLIEGGGSWTWLFLKHNLLNELYITLCPKIIGGRESPTLVDGEGFSLNDIKNLKLLEQCPDGDEIYLHYRVLEKG